MTAKTRYEFRPTRADLLVARGIRRVRHAQHRTLRQTAALLDCAPGHLSHVENGERRPAAAEFVARAMGVPLSEVLTPCPRCHYEPPEGYICGTCGSNRSLAREMDEHGIVLASVQSSPDTAAKIGPVPVVRHRWKLPPASLTATLLSVRPDRAIVGSKWRWAYWLDTPDQEQAMNQVNDYLLANTGDDFQIVYNSETGQGAVLSDRYFGAGEGTNEPLTNRKTEINMEA